MENIKRKDKHAYRLSYAYEVGSSFDPDMEDVARWERELNGTYICFCFARWIITNHGHT
jgi:hypothetical protein